MVYGARLCVNVYAAAAAAGCVVQSMNRPSALQQLSPASY